MTSDTDDERPFLDTVKVSAVLVMPGDPWPSDFHARFRDIMRVPVRVVWHEGTGTSDFGTPPSAAPDVADCKPGNQPHWAEPPLPTPTAGFAGRDPIGTLLRINRALDRVYRENQLD